jgi:hypothetical protein
MKEEDFDPKRYLHIRVTRLGEFSPVGWFFTMDIFLKIIEVAQKAHGKGYATILAKLFRLHFGRLFLKLIWSPCYLYTYVHTRTVELASTKSYWRCKTTPRRPEAAPQPRRPMCWRLLSLSGLGFCRSLDRKAIKAKFCHYFDQCQYQK